MTRTTIRDRTRRASVLACTTLALAGALVLAGGASPAFALGGGVTGFGDAHLFGAAAPGQLRAPVVGTARTADGGGYWEVAANGAVFAFGDAHTYSVAGAGTSPAQPVVGMAATPDGHGYWLVSANGGIAAYGDAGLYGSMGGKRLSQPVVGMASTPDGHGYWLVARDGGVFSFGDARFHGSMGGKPLNQPVVGVASTPSGGGYWIVASDGGVFTFGDARFHGSMGGKPLNQPVVGMASAPNGGGYWLVARDGGVFTFGDAHFYGSEGDKPIGSPVVGMASTPDGHGYWLVEATAPLGGTCQPSQLSIAYVPSASSGGAAGSVGLTYRLVNSSAAACTLQGYPGLQLQGARGQALPTEVTRRPFPSPAAQPGAVVLPPGGQAWFAIEYATQTGYGSLQCPRSAALAVTPPNDFQHLVVSGPGGQLQPYGGTIQALHCGEITTSPVLAHAPF